MFKILKYVFSFPYKLKLVETGNICKIGHFFIKIKLSTRVYFFKKGDFCTRVEKRKIFRLKTNYYAFWIDKVGFILALSSSLSYHFKTFVLKKVLQSVNNAYK